MSCSVHRLEGSRTKTTRLALNSLSEIVPNDTASEQDLAPLRQQHHWGSLSSLEDESLRIDMIPRPEDQQLHTRDADSMNRIDVRTGWPDLASPVAPD